MPRTPRFLHSDSIGKFDKSTPATGRQEMHEKRKRSPFTNVKDKARFSKNSEICDVPRALVVSTTGEVHSVTLSTNDVNNLYKDFGAKVPTPKMDVASSSKAERKIPQSTYRPPLPKVPDRSLERGHPIRRPTLTQRDYAQLAPERLDKPYRDQAKAANTHVHTEMNYVKKPNQQLPKNHQRVMTKPKLPPPVENSDSEISELEQQQHLKIVAHPQNTAGMYYREFRNVVSALILTTLVTCLFFTFFGLDGLTILLENIFARFQKLFEKKPEPSSIQLFYKFLRSI